MKTILFIFFAFINLQLVGQVTHDFLWANDGSSSDQQITIEAGDTVRWTWGSGSHNLRATSGTESFDTGPVIGPGHVFSYTFNQVGSTDYVCDPHQGNMYGTVTVSATAGIDRGSVLRFALYPNPVDDLLSIQLPTGFDKAEVSIYDYTGRNVLSKSITTSDQSIVTENLSRGIYLIRLTSNTRIGTKQFIKN